MASSKWEKVAEAAAGAREPAVILVDPVSSGRHLKSYVRSAQHRLIAIFTVDDTALQRAGKYLPHAEKVRHCDVVIEDSDVDRILAAVARLPYRIAAVIPASEPGVELADQLAARLELRGNPVASSAARRDKYESRLAVQRAGLNGPQFMACRTREQAMQFAVAHGLPVVVKTPRGAGAHHVLVCRRQDQVGAAFDEVIAGRNVFGHATSFVLVESFIRGPQYAVEIFGDGEALHVIAAWRFDFIANTDGSEIFEKALIIANPPQSVCDYAKAVGAAVGVRWGPCLVELRDDPARGPMLIEVGARLSGIDMPVLVRQISNFDPFAATLETYLAEPPLALNDIRFAKHAGLVFCPAGTSGTVAEVLGIDAIKELPSYVASNLYIASGDVISTSRELATIPLFVYLAHERTSQLEADMAAARRLFRIKLA
jgi:biotin carboxylase